VDTVQSPAVSPYLVLADGLLLGDKVKVKCVEFDAAEGKTRLSLKQMTPPPAGWVAPPPRPAGGRGGFSRGPRR
jgi:hypothetical protein